MSGNYCIQFVQLLWHIWTMWPRITDEELRLASERVHEMRRVIWETIMEAENLKELADQRLATAMSLLADIEGESRRRPESG